MVIVVGAGLEKGLPYAASTDVILRLRGKGTASRAPRTYQRREPPPRGLGPCALQEYNVPIRVPRGLSPG